MFLLGTVATDDLCAFVCLWVLRDFGCFRYSLSLEKNKAKGEKKVYILRQIHDHQIKGDDEKVTDTSTNYVKFITLP